ncbi:glycosyl hydrolases family 16 [Aspergillus luchuensis]|uniref:Glycosyl hydrolases family 16 n=1 Tax=Aspergillus kawachii TaxID=1069201 RepID=A0A146G177_ASPKA|nr:glycosyl hydrolases family 16 [Aspergillus luchuensis]
MGCLESTQFDSLKRHWDQSEWSVRKDTLNVSQSKKVADDEGTTFEKMLPTCTRCRSRRIKHAQTALSTMWNVPFEMKLYK